MEIERLLEEDIIRDPESLGKLERKGDFLICTETGTKQNYDCKKLAHSFNSSKASFNPNIKQVLNIITTKDKKTLVCIIGSHYFGPYISKFYNKSFAKI